MKHQLLARYPIGNPRRRWRQDNLLTAVDTPAPTSLEPKSANTHRKIRRAVKTTIDAGFDLIGTLWSDRESTMEILRAAERYGGSVLFQDLRQFGGMGHKNFCETNDYESAMREVSVWSSVKGYILWDEPILPESLAETRRMIDYCEKEYPGLLPYTVANPDYNRMCHWQDNAYAPYIERFITEIDPVQMDFDYYPIGKSEYDPVLQLDNSTMWACLEIVRRAAQRHGIPFWFYYQGQHFNWHKIHYTFRFPMARAMAYAGILHGAKATSCYVEFDGYIDPQTGGHGIFFDGQKRLNDELHALGNTLMALECLRVIHDDSLLPEHPTMEGLRTPMEESELLEGTLSPRLSISEHRDAYGNRYLMVLNRDYDVAQHVLLRLKRASHVYEVSKEDGEQALCYESVKLFEVSLEPGDLRLYRIQDAAEEPYTVEYYLEKSR